MESHHLLTVLAREAKVPSSHLAKLFAEVGERDRALLQKVVDLQLLPELDAYRTYAEVLGLEFENFEPHDLVPEIVNRLPTDISKRYRALPIREQDGALVVAMEDPLDLHAVDAIQEVLKEPMVPVLCPPSALKNAHEYLEKSARGIEGLLGKLDLHALEDSAFATPQRLKEIAGDDAIVRLVDLFVEHALRRKASDVHVEPARRHLRVRLRIDGNLETWQTLPRALHGAVTSRLKILANLDIAEKRKPQDGRFAIATGKDQRVEFRVSTLPSVNGEKTVLRVLDKRTVKLDLAASGFTQTAVDLIRHAASAPNGIVLVTGPTGSGKTTTLYGVLNHLNTEDANVSTVEDPVEYELDGITQVQVDPKADRTFATTLRSLLRQDPDVIMVGEIRDHETAEIALHAALTGHVVLSTLHTNSAVSTVTRLVDMGIEKYLLAPSLRAIVAQRLVRKLCPSCAEPEQAPPDLVRSLGLDPTDPKVRFKKAKGCPACRDRGYVGRMPIHEVLVWTAELAQCLVRGGGEAELEKLALEGGFRTMTHDGVEKALQGTTSLSEVLAAVRVRG